MLPCLAQGVTLARYIEFNLTKRACTFWRARCVPAATSYPRDPNNPSPLNHPSFFPTQVELVERAANMAGEVIANGEWGIKVSKPDH